MYGLAKLADDYGTDWNDWVTDQPSLTAGVPVAAGSLLLQRKFKRPVENSVSHGLGAGSVSGSFDDEREVI
jgi:hypothetical protein